MTDQIAADNQCVIDWSVLDGLKAMQRPGRPDISKTLMKAYLDSIPTLMEGAKAALSASDGNALRNTAHSMKSSSRAIGAMLIGNTCAELELLGKNNTLEAVPALLGRAEKELAETCAALRTALECGE
jgi:HPt (histidine-containing phosphotransfer) domain-containing protein